MGSFNFETFQLLQSLLRLVQHSHAKYLFLLQEWLLDSYWTLFIGIYLNQRTTVKWRILINKHGSDISMQFETDVVSSNLALDKLLSTCSSVKNHPVYVLYISSNNTRVPIIINSDKSSSTIVFVSKKYQIRYHIQKLTLIQTRTDINLSKDISLSLPTLS